jgi:TetR/AcrR family transcriptional regulator, transcriptional repressor for nem operon
VRDSTHQEKTSTAETATPGGRETPKMHILDGVERLMIEKGYAGVTYRALAAAAGVSPALVQYYFPTLDDVFLAAMRRSVDAHIERFTATLKERNNEPLRVLWEFSRDRATAALMIELTALGNRRPSIKAEIGQATERLRQVQLDALAAASQSHPPVNSELSPAALVFLLTGIPKLIALEASVGASTAHVEVIDAFERYLDIVEPRNSDSAAAQSADLRPSRQPAKNSDARD